MNHCSHHRKTIVFLFLFTATCFIANVSYAQKVERHIYKKTPQGDLTIDIHYPKNWKAADERPCILFFFGGGWNGGTVEQFTPQATYFASRGLVAARADYRVKSRHGTKPEQSVEDGKSAIRWLKQNSHLLGIAPNRIIASGGSSGGHVAACTFLTAGFETENEAISSKPGTLLLFNPVLSLMEFNLAQRAESEETAIAISPLLQLNENLPPTMMFYGTQDKYMKQGQEFVRKANKLKVSVEIFVAQNAKHGFFNQPPWLQQTMIAADRFLAKLGLLHGEPTITLEPTPKPTPKQKAQEPVDEDHLQTRRFRVSFEEHHPLSKDKELTKRIGIRMGIGRHSGYFYDSKQESYEVYVPTGYDGNEPYGLFVWISASQSGDIPDHYMPVMDKHKIIWIGANESGNKEDVRKRRIPLALDAVYNMQQHYNIDRNRTYISGVSGGGRVSSFTAMHHSDVYAGGIFIIGANYWEKKESPSERGRYFPAGFPKPKPVYLRKAEREGRYVLLTGETDFNREQMKLYYEEGYSRHLNEVMYMEVPGMGHTIPPVDWFEKAIQYVDNPKLYRD